MSNTEIGRQVGMTRQTVIAWRARYEAGGIGALADLPRCGRPPVIDESAVITSTLNPPPDELGVTHWSSRLLADRLTREGRRSASPRSLGSGGPGACSRIEPRRSSSPPTRG